MLDRTFARYLAVGVANTAVGLGSTLVLLRAGIGPVTANALGYVCGILCSYALNRRYTFRSGGRHRRELPRFVAVVAVGYGLNLLVLRLCLDRLGWPAAAAQFPAMATYTLSTYALSRWLVFRAGRGAAGPAV